MTYAKITFLLQKLNRYFTSSKPLFSCSLHMVFTQWYNTLFIYIIIWIVNLIVYARTKVATSQNTLPIHFCLPHLSATTFYKDHICLKKRVNKSLWFLIILDLIHLANQSLPIYMDIQIYIKYNDSYRLHVMGKGVGVCVKKLIGDVHCANYMYGEQKAKRK